VRVEGAEVVLVEVRRGGERGERGDVGLHLAVEGEREGLGGAGQALLEGGAVVPGHAPGGGAAEGEGGQQHREDEGHEVRPQAAPARPGDGGRCRHSAPLPSLAGRAGARRLPAFLVLRTRTRNQS
jgi:hypothetical protein